MKASSAVFASFLAASTVALSSCSAGDCSVAVISSHAQRSAEEEARRLSIEEKFAPRLDGLRFIETLVTAHR